MYGTLLAKTDPAVIAAWGSVAAALGSFAAALATAYLAAKTRDMAKATESTVEVAQRQAKEATRARIDARAPQLAVSLDPISWLPYDQKPGTMVPDGTGGQSRVAPLTPGTSFGVPQQDERLWFLTKLHLRNDGRSTGIVDLHRTQPGDYISIIAGGRQIGGYGAGPTGLRYSLEPGGEAEVQVMTSLTVGQAVRAWGNRAGVHPADATMTVNITFADQFEDGVTDQIELKMIAYPLLETSRGVWSVRDRQDEYTDETPAITGGPERTRRTYPGEAEAESTAV